MKKKIDCYGFPCTSVDYFTRKKTAVDVVTKDKVTYMRFDLADKCAIHKIDSTHAGLTQIRWTFGAWEQRESLVYTLDLNTPMTIESNN